MKKGKFLDRQTGRQEQRMRNILVVLALFVCTSICLGGQEITINGDIGVRAKTMKLEHDVRIAARKKKEEEREAEWAKERAEWEKKLWAQRKRDKLELEREEKLRAEERAVSRAELDEYEAKRSDREQRTALYGELRAEGRVGEQRVWTVSRAELDKYEAERYKEPQAKKEWYGKWAQKKKERVAARAKRKEQGQLTAKLWNKPLSELEKQLVDREKQLVDRNNKYKGFGSGGTVGLLGLDLELTLEWEELLAARAELDKRLAAERAAWMKKEEESLMKKLEEWEKERKEELKKLALLDMEQTMKDGKHMEQCLESLKRAGAGEAVYPDIAGNGSPELNGRALTDDDGNAIWKDPNNNSLTIKPGVKVGDVFGAKMNKASVDKNKDNKAFLSMTNNEVIVSGGEFGCGNTNGDIAGAWADDDIADLMNISSNTVRITGGSKIGNVFGGRAYKGTVSSSTVRITGGSKIGNVYGGCAYDGTVSSNTVRLEGRIDINGEIDIGGNVFGGYVVFDGTVSSNTVIINWGRVGGDVLGGYVVDGTAIGNTVEITNTTVGRDVYGARIVRNLASSNTVTINDGKVEGSVFGGYIEGDGTGTATGNKVNLIGMGVVGDINENNVFGAKINGSGLASSNTVTITGGMIGFVNSVAVRNVYNVYGGYIAKDGEATGNTVTINGGKIGGNVFGGYVGGKGKGKAINNTITITGKPKFSERTILCGGVAKDDAVTGNTLNIFEMKRVEVKGISNFENYNFYLTKGEIKGSWDPILITKSGGCSWDIDTDKYTEPCAVDLLNKKIYIYTNDQITLQAVCVLINSKRGFKGPPPETSKLSEDKSGGEWVTYEWELNVDKIFGEECLIARLIAKESGSKGQLVAGGYGTLLGLVNQGTDFVVSRIEEAERLVGGGEGEIEAFFGVGANKSRYNTGTEIEMVGTSMIGGIAIGMEVGGKGQSPEGQSSKGQSLKGQSPKELVTGVFVEHGNGDSEIICEKKSKGSNEYTGVGVLGKYNLYEDEERGRKIYGEAVLRTGCVSNKFKGNGLKDDRGKELEYEAGMMYEGCAGGLGYKHKVSEKIDLDWSFRYMFGRQNGKDVTMSDGRIVKFENVISNRIKVGVRGTYRDIEQIKPYVGIWYEHELGGKIKAVVQDAQDQVKIPASSFGGWTGVGELGVSGKVWKFGVDISGQGYLGVRKGFGGMLKLKYAFGKDAHGSKASSLASSLASSKSPRS